MRKSHKKTLKTPFPLSRRSVAGRHNLTDQFTAEGRAPETFVGTLRDTEDR